MYKEDKEGITIKIKRTKGIIVQIDSIWWFSKKLRLKEVKKREYPKLSKTKINTEKRNILT